MKRKLVFIFIVSLVGFSTLKAQIRPLQVSTDLKLPAPRWMFEKSEVVKSQGFAKSLYAIRKSKELEKFDRCLKLIQVNWKRAGALQPWLLVEELECARYLGHKTVRRKQKLRTALLKLDNHPDWMIAKPYSRFLKKGSVQVHLTLLEVEVKSSRSKAWKLIDRLQQMRSWLTEEERAKVYRIAGEMAFLQQNLLLAEDYILRSLNEKESRELQRKLVSIRKSLVLDKSNRIKGEASNKNRAANAALEPTEEERKLQNQFQNFLKTGDWVSALEDGVELLKKYPGGTRADYVQKKILRVYRKIAKQRDKKWILIRSRILELMKKANGEQLYFWGKRAFGWGYYADSYKLAHVATQKLDGMKLSTDAHLLAARAANTIGEYNYAEAHYEKLIVSHSGSEESLEALFRLGLVKFRLKKYSEAVAKFERLQNITSESKFDLQARYWQWRSLQKQGDESAKIVGEKLYKRYPLTYYGIRALAELSSLKNFLKSDTKNLKTTLWLSEGDNRVWERYSLLLAGGWFLEAQEELAFFPDPNSAEEKLIYSKLWGLAFNHYKSISLAQEAWDEDRSLLSRKMAHLAFPLEFRSYVKKWSNKNNLDIFKVFALIKQESSFRKDVSSPSGAVGLMQLMLPTAREIKTNLQSPEHINSITLTKADLNIRFGSYYLKRLMNAYDGHFPLALAGYNVGIGNMRKWLRARPKDFEGLSQKNSDPENEIWMDELAWDETSYYVKAVMRNYLIYQLLYRPLDKIPSPTWTHLKAKSTNL